MRHWKWWHYVLLAIAVFMIAGGILAWKLRPIVQAKLISMMQDEFNSDIKYSHIWVVPGWTVRASVDDVVLQLRNRPGLPPLIQMKQMSMEVRMSDIFKLPIHVASVRVQGLQIHMPPRRPPSQVPPTSDSGGRSVPHFIVNVVNADGAELYIIPHDPDKDPIYFPVQHLHMYQFGPHKSSEYYAELTNPKPKGLIVAQGEFGPWNADEPSDSPCSGKYTLTHADLNTIKGLGGILTSAGEFSGAIGSLNVTGTTTTPDFSLDVANNPMPLTTQFTAQVDGTSGDTYLQDVQATLGKSDLFVTGAIVGQPKSHGRAIEVQTETQQARVQDFLRLATPGNKPLMTGAMILHANIFIPPGEEDVTQKMKLDGTFGVAGAHFKKEAVQNKVDELSRKAIGQPNAVDIGDVVSNLRGQFTMGNGVINFANLSFDAPGASVNLNGKYTVNTGEMDFHGTLKMKAKLSQTQTGVKSFFLKPFDPIFSKKGAGTVLPIKITGTRDNPSFGLDFHRKDDTKNGDKNASK